MLIIQRWQTQTVTVFGVAGLLLSLLGVFAVMSYTVSQQTHEIGIRMAVGARRSDVARWVLERGLVLISAGLALGLLGSFWAVQLLQSLVEGVVPVEPLLIAGAVALLMLTATAATWLPARRAAGLDPLVALRQE